MLIIVFKNGERLKLPKWDLNRFYAMVNELNDDFMLFKDKPLVIIDNVVFNINDILYIRFEEEDG